MATVFETIKDRLPINEVIASYIPVTGSGSSYKARCPFHNEKTPSFNISADKGFYYCFGCGAKGDIFNFVEQFEGLDKRGALKVLAEKAGVTLEDKKYSEKNDFEGIYQILEKATDFYQKNLLENAEVISYLENRGLTKESIKDFRIGYANDSWQDIVSLCKSKEDLAFATRAGLVKKTPKTEGKSERDYDVFRKRIMFPICDSGGRVIAFSGRSFPEDEKSSKYLNSPETEIFHKSKVLFGFDKAKFHIKKNNFAILVEGQIDLVLSHQKGFRNTVATSGTAISEDAKTDRFSNLAVLSRLSPNLFMAFDGDVAGAKALDRASLVALSLGMNPKVVYLPNGKDPADCLSEFGTDFWKDSLKDSRHFIDHHLQLLKKEKLSPFVFTEKVKQKIFPFLARVSSPIEKNLYINDISKEISLDAKTILEELSQYKTDLKTDNSYENIKSQKIQISAYERLTALRKEFPSEEIEEVSKSLDSLSFDGQIFSVPSIDENNLEISSILVKREYKDLKDKEKTMLAKELVENIKKDFFNEMKSKYSTLLKDLEKTEDQEEIDRVTKLLQELHKMRTTN